jgi:hypothetical protein
LAIPRNPPHMRAASGPIPPRLPFGPNIAIFTTKEVSMDLIGSFFALLFMLVCFAVWLLPILFIAGSDRADGKEKLAWILAVIFISWFAWVFYLLLAPLKRRDPYGYRR